MKKNNSDNKKRQNKRINKKVFLLTPMTFPVPAVSGGAVQTIISNLICVNEEYGNIRFMISSPFDKRASKKKFIYSKVYYFKNGIEHSFKGAVLYFLWKSDCVIKKIKTKFRSGKDSKSELVSMDFLMYQYCDIVKREKPDVIVLENIRQNQIKKYEPLKKYVGDNNIFYHVHWTHTASITERQVVPNSISISEYVKKEWIKEASDFGRNYVLYNCVDIEKFSSLNYDRILERKRIGINENDIVVIFCGRFIPVKGISELLTAFEMINNPNIKLLLIGSANYSLPNETEFSKGIVERAKRMNNVIYHGYVPNEEMPKYYAASDIMAVPSVWEEGAGLVAIEGMASGLPLVITQSGGMVEYVTDDCAIKLPIDSALSNNLANSIVELSEKYDLREKMGKAGIKRAKQFSVENYYKNFLKIIEDENCFASD